jgi:glycerol-3-phosphate dehydrogenase
MERNLEHMASQSYDLLVIGGGIYGACVAWDAAQRGLRTALVEQHDFGHATSANSLKTLHGGLRYLQDGNLPLTRTMIRERRAWLHIAPHLTRPLPFLLPTHGHGKHSRPILAAALKLNDLVAHDRNHGLPPTHHLPASRTFSRQQAIQQIPALANLPLTGAAQWYDAQLLDSERLLLTILHAAVTAGADIANYAAAQSLLRTANRVSGANVVDCHNGRIHPITAQLTINCTGAWTDALLSAAAAPRFSLSLATNLITRQIVPHTAVGFFSHTHTPDGQPRRRILFAVPWGDYSIIGTLHQPCPHTQPTFRLPEATIQAFLDEINTAWPAAALSRADVRHVQIGYLPTEGNVTDEVHLLRQERIHDHEAEDGLPGLLTAVGVKYTTARHVAEQLVDLAAQKLARPLPPSRTATTTLAAATPPANETERHLYGRYGLTTPQLITLLQQNPAWANPITHNPCVLAVEIIHAIRHEMAHTLTDVIRRRTPLGAAGPPPPNVLHTCAHLIAAELGWLTQKTEEEVTAVIHSYN